MRKLLIIISCCIPGAMFAQGINKFQYGVDGNLSSAFIGSDAGNYTFIYYYSNGHRSSTGKFKDGEKHGTWKTWNENGKLTAVAHYKNGEKSGKWIIKKADHTSFEISFNHNHMTHAFKKDNHGHIITAK